VTRVVTPDSLKRLEETIHWVNTTYCVRSEDYDEKERRLFYSFADVLNSPILVNPSPPKDSSSSNGPASDKVDADLEFTSSSSVI
jgi:hypothetical protein